MQNTEIRELLKQALRAPYEMQQLSYQFDGMASDTYLNFLETHWVQIIHDFVLHPPDYHKIYDLTRAITQHDSANIKEDKAQAVYVVCKSIIDSDTGAEPGLENYKQMLTLSEKVLY